MKRKFNKKQITFVLIAVCLVGLIGLGVSYSYYLASIRTSNEENKSTDISTLGITSVVMDMQGKISSNGAYPGHKMVKEVVVRGIGAENAKPANASIRITPELGDFSEDVTWKLYKSEEAITCSSVEHTDGREYYDESTCNIPTSASLVLEGSSDSDYLNIVVSPNTATKYYLVVEYLNRSDKDQNNQMGKSFSIDIGLGEKYVRNIVSEIIAQLDTSGKCPTVNDDGTVNVTAKEQSSGYLCNAKDAYGTSYYYRGNVSNNYVKFGKWADDAPDKVFGYYSADSVTAKEYSSLEECQSASSYNNNCEVISYAGKDMYWRIVRINGDGSIRLIYDGTSTHANSISSQDREIGVSVFNTDFNDNTYAGYMYGTADATTYADAHSNTNDSSIKTYIDSWYEKNLKGTDAEQYLADNIFCNDRSLSSAQTGTAAGRSNGYYRWYDDTSNNKMMLTCPQQNDAFTVDGTVKGNGALTYKVGMISADEAVLAGTFDLNSNNKSFFLYNGREYWTMSPMYYSGYYGGGLNMRYIDQSGDLNYMGVTVRSYGVRPVINISSDALKSGVGSRSNPYTLSED